MTASGITGFTFPGMIEDPGWSSGSLSSAKPVRGPEPIHRMSSAILKRLPPPTHPAPGARFGGEPLVQPLQRREQLPVHREEHRDVDRRRDHVVARLAHVDVV